VLSESLPREVVATHEAGHAVCALAVGARVDLLTIEATERFAGVVAGQTHFDDSGLQPSELAVVWLGGRAAQLRVSTNDLGCGNDLQFVRELCAQPGVSFGVAVEAANRIITERWAEVERLADALLQRGTLTAPELRAGGAVVRTPHRGQPVVRLIERASKR
jgi:ATP-dependent Zn protease